MQFAFICFWVFWYHIGCLAWKKSGKVREFRVVREMSEGTVLGLTLLGKVSGTNFFRSLRSHIICTPTFELAAPPLVKINCLV